MDNINDNNSTINEKNNDNDDGNNFNNNNNNNRFEAVGAFIIAVMLMAAGYGIGNHSFETLRVLASGAGGGGGPSIPTKLTAIAALVSIVAKEALFRVRKNDMEAYFGGGESGRGTWGTGE